MEKFAWMVTLNRLQLPTSVVEEQELFINFSGGKK
jgi:hypothetical protein